MFRAGEDSTYLTPEGALLALHAFPRKGARPELLVLSAQGLWVRDQNRFGFFRPGHDGWGGFDSGKWVFSRRFVSSELTQVHVEGETSPLLRKQGVRLIAGTEEVEEQRTREEPVQVVEHESPCIAMARAA